MKKLIQHELDKFIETNSTAGSAIAVVNPDGSQITGGTTNVSAGLISLASQALVKASQDGTWNVNISTPTLYAVVNTSAAGVGQSLVTVNNFPANQAVSFSQLVSLPSGTEVKSVTTITNWPTNQLINFSQLISLVSGTEVKSLATINNFPTNYPVTNLVSVASINGLLDVKQNGSWDIRSLLSTATLFAVVNTGSSNTLTSLASGTEVKSLATILNWPTTLTSLASGTELRSLATIMNFPASYPVTNLVSIASINGLISASQSGTWNVGIAGLVSLASGTSVLTSFSGLISLASGTEIRSLATILNWPTTQPVSFNQLISLASGTSIITSTNNLTSLASGTQVKTFPVSNITLNASNAFIGLVSTASIKGNVGIATGTNFIGLATVIPTPISGYTSLATVISASGNATLFTPPSSNRWMLKDLIIGSQGQTQVGIISGANTVIPPIALATMGGYISNFGDSCFPAKAINDAFVVVNNSAVTISVTANIRFQTT